MATSKGKMLKEQITFSFFDEIKVEKPTKPKKEKNVETTKQIKKEEPRAEKVKVVKQYIFRKEKSNIKPNHRKLNRKVRKF